MSDKIINELSTNLAMLTVQTSSMNQILMGLLMVLDPAVLKSVQETIQESHSTHEDGSLDQMASNFALAQIELALNGPAPKGRLRVVTAEKDN